MPFSAKTLSMLVLLSLGLSGLVLLLLALSQGRRMRQSRGPVQLDDALRSILEGHARAIQRLEQVARALNSTDRRQEQLIEGAVSRVGLLRYDAFEDVGGRLSFSCALLDDHGSGVVVTSINGRQDTRVYAKPVSEGGSVYSLSAEEEEAIKRAIEAPREKVAT
jgi:hypothetical protein